MAEFSIAVRFLHLVATLLPLGILAFVCCIARPAARKTGIAGENLYNGVAYRLWRLLADSLGVAFITGIVGLLLQGAVMTGLAPQQTLEPRVLTTVLATQYGNVWLARLVLLAGLAVVAFRLMRGRNGAFLPWLGLALAAAYAAGPAFAGHAASGEGIFLVLQLAADVLHLLAAGAWLGALLPLALLLQACGTKMGAACDVIVQEATRRFSIFGLVTVTILLVTGTYNAWQLVGDVPPLLGTTYGHLLLLKLALLVPLLTLAATNLLSIRPRLLTYAGSDTAALTARLGRNALLEAGIGGAILLIVAVLGVTAPARHVQPEWPFQFRYSWAISKNYPAQRTAILAGAGLAAFALLPLGYALLRRRYRPIALGFGFAALGGSAALALPALWVDAYPTTYRRPAIPYQAISIQSGLQSYQALCVPCHGVGGFGDGAAGARLKPKPADLTAKHTDEHTAGDLFWWISQGKAGTGMPGFAPQLSEEQRWDLINFLRSLSAAERAREMNPLLEQASIVAPDFSYRTAAGISRNLKDHRGRNAVLLALFSWPHSEARLTQLADLQGRLASSNVVVLLVPADAAGLDTATRGKLSALKLDPVMDGSQEAFAAYALFRRSVSEAGMQPDPPLPRHMEFLIDPQGYLRARWIAGESRGWSNADLLLREIAQMNREEPSAPAPDDHVH